MHAEAERNGKQGWVGLAVTQLICNCRRAPIVRSFPSCLKERSLVGGKQPGDKWSKGKEGQRFWAQGEALKKQVRPSVQYNLEQ